MISKYVYPFPFYKSTQLVVKLHQFDTIVRKAASRGTETTNIMEYQLLKSIGYTVNKSAAVSYMINHIVPSKNIFAILITIDFKP